MSDGEWFTYDKTTAYREDGELRFEIQKTGLSKTDATREAMKDNITMAKLTGEE